MFTSLHHFFLLKDPCGFCLRDQTSKSETLYRITRSHQSGNVSHSRFIEIYYEVDIFEQKQFMKNNNNNTSRRIADRLTDTEIFKCWRFLDSFNRLAAVSKTTHKCWAKEVTKNVAVFPGIAMSWKPSRRLRALIAFCAYIFIECQRRIYYPRTEMEHMTSVTNFRDFGEWNTRSDRVASLTDAFEGHKIRLNHKTSEISVEKRQNFLSAAWKSMSNSGLVFQFY